MSEAYQGWARVELMGHRVRFGQVREVEQYGAKMLRVDVPNPAEPSEPLTEFYNGPAIYAVTPMSEQMCRDKIGDRDIRPPSPLQYQRLPAPAAHDAGDRDDEGEEDFGR
jgi:hypothetical protein